MNFFLNANLEKMKLILAIVLSLVLVANCFKLADLPRKSLAGPPSEFANNAIPEPLSGALVEDSAYFEVTLAPKESDVANHKINANF
jgi:hypothetical protein